MSVTTTATVAPTIVLVHGAWADASSFAPVTEELQKKGYKVLSAPNPLRGLESDARNVAAFVNQHTTGPVVLVGHSYGGSVITEAAGQIPTVKELVYINAYAPDEGENAIELSAIQPGSLLAVPDPTTVFDFVRYSGAAPGDVDTYVKSELFRKILATNLSKRKASVLATAQSPVALSALQAPTTAVAWRHIRSFFFVGTEDNAIPPAEQFAMAERAGGVVESAKAGHLSMLEVPHKVASLIERAAKAD